MKRVINLENLKSFSQKISGKSVKFEKNSQKSEHLPWQKKT